MVNKKARGKRAKTRSKLRGKGRKATVNDMLRPFEPGQKVQVDIRSEAHSGMPSAIYHGSSGVVREKRGSSYEVDVMKGNLGKTLVVHPVHLKALEAHKK